MPSLADVIQQMGPTILYDERTQRFHDMSQNYKMVSTRDVVAGGPARADNRGMSGYVTQDAFNAFQAEIYLYIGKVAFFTREALVEMQRTMAGEQEDTEALRNDEQRSAEERRERRRELVRGALTNISSGTRQVTGMGPLGALFTGLFATLTGVLANTDIERIRETFNSIGEVFDNIREFFNKLQEYSNIILAIGVALAAMVAANMLDRTRPSPRQAPSTQRPPPSTGLASPGNRPPATPSASAPATPSTGAAPSTSSAAPASPSRPSTTPGAPTSAAPPQSGQPTQDRPAGNKSARLGRFLGALGPIVQVFSARQQLETLSEQRDGGNIDENAYRDEVIRTIAGTAGAIVGGAAGGALGSLLGPAGALVGGFAGSLGGAELAERLATTGIGRRIGELIYDRFFADRSTGEPETQLIAQLTELQRQSRQRVLDTDEMVNTTERAVNEGRLTKAQARQINEIGSQAGTVRRAGDIEAVIDAISASGLEGANSRLIAGREQGTGRIIVLPTMYQEVVTQRASSPPAAAAPAAATEIQTRTPDPTLGQASQAATFSGGQQRGGLIDRARARNAR